MNSIKNKMHYIPPYHDIFHLPYTICIFLIPPSTNACPSCLFSFVPNDDVIDDILSSLFTTDSTNSIPLVDDDLYACTSFTGIRVIHHNVQAVHSKMDDLASCFSVCNEKNVIY